MQWLILMLISLNSILVAACLQLAIPALAMIEQTLLDNWERDQEQKLIDQAIADVQNRDSVL